MGGDHGGNDGLRRSGAVDRRHDGRRFPPHPRRRRLAAADHRPAGRRPGSRDHGPPGTSRHGLSRHDQGSLPQHQSRRQLAALAPSGRSRHLVDLYSSDQCPGSLRRRQTADPGLPDRVIMAFACRVMRVDIDPNAPDDVYATLEANGCIRSRNGGQSWEDCTADLIRFCEEPKYRSRIGSQTEVEGMLDGHALACSAAAPGSVFLANRMGLFRSDDKGQNWRDMEISRFSPLTYGRDIRVSPHDPKVLYACLSPAARSLDGSIYRSDDVGQTWKRFDHGFKAEATMMGVAVNPKDPNQVFGVSRFGQVFATLDGGKSWSESHLPDGVRDVYAVACG